MRPHHRDDTSTRIGGGLECLGFPLHQGALHIVALRLAGQHLADIVTVMREVGVETHEASVAGFVNASDGVPGGWRRFVVNAQIAFAAALDGRMHHVDGDALRLAAAGFPYFRGGKSGDGNRDLRRGAHAE